MISGLKQIAKNIALLSIASMTSLFLGLLRGSIVAARFGTGRMYDAFLIAATIADTITYFASKGFVTFVPIFSQELNEKGEEMAWEAGSRILSAWILLVVAVIGGGYLLLPWIVPLIAPGFNENDLKVTLHLSKILIVAGLFTALTTLATFLSHSYQKFFFPSMGAVISNIVIIVGLVIFVKMGINDLAAIMVVGAFASLLVQATAFQKMVRFFRFRLDTKHPAVRNTLRLSLPIYVGRIGTMIDALINRSFSSMLSAGSLSALSYGVMIAELPITVVAEPILYVFYPIFSKNTADKNIFSAEFSRALKMSSVIIPMSVGLIVLSTPIVRLLFERGAFTHESTALTAGTLSLLAIGLQAEAWSVISASALMANQDTKTPISIGLIRVLVVVVLNYILIKPFGIAGLALATSLANCVKLALFISVLRRRRITFDWGDMIVYVLKVLIASIVMGGVVQISALYLESALLPAISFLNQLSLVIITIGIGIFVFSVMAWLLKLKEAFFFYNLLREKVRKLAF